jgi:DNA-binding beta-propeller fold protein YncE
VALACLLLAACTSAPQPGGRDSATARSTGDAAEYRPVWPRPPQAARIRYVETFAVPEDLGIRPGGLRRLVNAIAGEKSAGMVRPYGISVQGERILVCDPGLRAVHLFDRGENDYRLIDGADGQRFGAPVGIALANDRVFVADSAAGKVFMFDIEGELQGHIDELERPTGLAWDSVTQRLFVADTLGHRILAFDGRGNLLFRFGDRGTGPGQFNFPSHLGLSGGRLLVNDSMNFRVQAFDTDGGFLSGFGDHGDGSGYLSQPKGISADSDGNVYVAGATIDRVQIFSPEGEFLLAFGGTGHGLGQFVMPAGVTIADDRIYVADSHNSRVQVFQYVRED